MTISEPDPLDPEGGTSSARPAWWTAGAQTRQFGVGGANTLKPPPSVLGALTSPPANMTEAAALALTDNSVVTPNDKTDYWPAP